MALRTQHTRRGGVRNVNRPEIHRDWSAPGLVESAHVTQDCCELAVAVFSNSIGGCCRVSEFSRQVSEVVGSIEVLEIHAVEATGVRRQTRIGTRVLSIVVGLRVRLS